MTEKPAHDGPERLSLRGELAELPRVAAWVEALAARYSLTERAVFSIDLCLEEALSNIVRHGYEGKAGKPIQIEFRRTACELIFTIEDEAPQFEPEYIPIPQHQSLEDIVPGGLGIPLMRQFADRVNWEPLETGNRLTLGFSLSN